MHLKLRFILLYISINFSVKLIRITSMIAKHQKHYLEAEDDLKAELLDTDEDDGLENFFLQFLQWNVPEFQNTFDFIILLSLVYKHRVLPDII